MPLTRYKRFIPLLCAMLILAMTGCQSDEIAPSDKDTSGGLTVTCSVLLPDMGKASSRGSLGDTPGESLKLTVLEFDLGVDAAHSFLSNIYEAEPTSPTNVNNGGIVNFKFTLKAAGTPKVLHLLIADKIFTPGFGSMASILPGIDVGAAKNDYWTTATKEAYWGCVEFPDGFTDLDAYGNPTLKDGVQEKLTNVPVIRNFAKLSVTLDENVSNFRLLGFEIVNMPTAGTVAPWEQSTLSVPQLLATNESGAIAKPYAMKKFSDIHYGGIIAGSAQFVNTEVEAKSWTAGNMTTAARYIYEHPYESTRRTYIIVHGEYCTDQSDIGNPDKWKKGFYKLDIGMRNSDGSFNYYNIIRNIHYIIKIQSVSAKGSPSVQDAIRRAPFNNLTASTETASMLNVSDGENILYVNATRHIIINTEPVTILYKYVNINGNADNMGTPTTVGLKAGDVIESYTEAVESTENAGWMEIKIQPKEPTDITARQSFSIMDGRGLGRTINLVLRKPWEFAKIEGEQTAVINNGSNNDYSWPSQAISNQAGEAFSVYFNLPNGLPETIFPLDFVIQSKNQGIENNKIDNMVVTTGSSLFNPDATAIAYIKTVSYAEYSYKYIGDESSDLDVNAPNVNHTIRCRFLTINAGSEPGEIKIHNPYFGTDASVTFNRDKRPQLF